MEIGREVMLYMFLLIVIVLIAVIILGQISDFDILSIYPI